MDDPRFPPCTFWGDFTWPDAAREAAAGYSGEAIWTARLEQALRLREVFRQTRLHARRTSARTDATTAPPTSAPAGVVGGEAPRPEGLSDRDLRLLAALLHALMSAATPSPRILDFGGALGEHYFRLRPFVPVERLEWHIVEIPEAVARAVPAELGEGELRFHTSMEGVSLADAALASGSLQYVESPGETLRALTNKTRRLILDRMPFCDHLERDRLTIQRVPPEIHDACYPAWFFSRILWERRLAELGFRPLMAWRVREDAAHLEGVKIIYSGLLAAKGEEGR